MNENITLESELGYFTRQALIEKLVHRFAAINGFKIEPDLQVLDAKHPQIRVWVAMALSAIEEMDNLINVKGIEETEP